MTRDPLGEEGGLNLYAAMGNSVVNIIDPVGLNTPEGYENMVKNMSCKRLKKHIKDMKDTVYEHRHKMVEYPGKNQFPTARTIANESEKLAIAMREYARRCGNNDKNPNCPKAVPAPIPEDNKAQSKSNSQVPSDIHGLSAKLPQGQPAYISPSDFAIAVTATGIVIIVTKGKVLRFAY